MRRGRISPIGIPWTVFLALVAGCAATDRAAGTGSALFEVEDYGFCVRLPQAYLWRTVGFQYGIGPGTLAEWSSADQGVGGILYHDRTDQDVHQYAAAAEAWSRARTSVRSMSQVKEDSRTAPDGSVWLIREYEQDWEGTPLVVVNAFASRGGHLLNFAMWCAKTRWSEVEPVIQSAIRSLEFAGATPAAFKGVFSLQALIDFDSLDGAAIDPATGIVTLFGHRTHADRLVPIAYLDHLATALESRSPTLDLRWLPESQAEIERALEIGDDELVDRLSALFDANGRLLPLGEWWYRLGGAEAKTGMTRYEANAAALRATGRSKEADALLIIGLRDDALARGDEQASRTLFHDLCRVLGIYDEIMSQWKRYDAGQITSEQLLDATLPSYVGAVAAVFGQNSQVHRDGYFARRHRGADPDAAMEQTVATIVSPENQKTWLSRVLFTDLLGQLSEVHVPFAEASRILGAVPRVSPKFEHLEPRSLMARVAYEADVLGKRLLVMPELKDRIPGYRTFFEWRRTVRGALDAQSGHLWFSPDGFEVRESADGRMVQFGRAPVRIHLHRYEDGASVADPKLDAYAGELTALYDDLADAFSVLHELRECMKVVALADWLRKRGVRLAFPEEGRARWNPPKEAPGIVEIVVAVKEAPVGAVLWALGGVDFDGRSTTGSLPAWKFSHSEDRAADLPAGALNSPVISLKKRDEQIQGALGRKVEVPLPEIPGWCAQAQGGAKARRYVSFAADRLAGREDAAEVFQQLEKVRRSAERLEQYDRALNALTRQRIDALGDLRNLRADAETTATALAEQAEDTLRSVALSGAEAANLLRPYGAPGRQAAEEIMELIGKLEEQKTLAEDLQAALNGYRSGRFDADSWNRASARLADLGVELRRRTLALQGTHPTVMRFLSNRTALLLSAAHGLGNLAAGTGELVLMRRMVSDLDETMGDQALASRKLQESRRACQDEYLNERRKFEAMLGR